MKIPMLWNIPPWLNDGTLTAKPRDSFEIFAHMLLMPYPSGINSLLPRVGPDSPPTMTSYWLCYLSSVSPFLLALSHSIPYHSFRFAMRGCAATLNCSHCKGH